MGEKLLRLLLLLVVVSYYEVVTVVALLIGVLLTISLQRPKTNSCRVGLLF